jgi:hypothetical protein
MTVDIEGGCAKDVLGLSHVEVVCHVFRHSHKYGSCSVCVFVLISRLCHLITLYCGVMNHQQLPTQWVCKRALCGVVSGS